MFKNKAFQVRMVQDNTPTAYASAPRETHWTPEVITEFVQEQVKSLAVVLAALYAVKITLDTTSQIAVNKSSRHK